MPSAIRILLAASVLVGALGVRAGADAPSWEVVDEEDGIRLWRAAAGDASAGRATTVVDAPLCDVLAIVREVEGYCDWMADCVEARELARESPFANELYLRISGVGWVGVADRDVALATRTARRGDHVVVSFAAQSGVALHEADDTVRMPKLDGSYRLSPQADGRTEVDYRFVADLGGRVPDWIARRVVTRLPRETLRGLREVAARRRGTFAAVIAGWPELAGGLPCAVTAVDAVG